VTIDPEMEALLEKLPDAKSGILGRTFTPEEDAILLKYWPVKCKRDIAKLLHCHENTARRRYKELTAE
jgi:hypothetical protein